MKALFTPTERLTVRLIGDYLNVDEQATPFSLLQVNQNAYVALYNTCISGNPGFYARSEEHTSELQSLMRISYAVFCLKKKKQPQKHQTQQGYSHTNNTDTNTYK